MPEPTPQHRHNFANFDHSDLSAPLAESVLFARDRASTLLDKLPAKRSAILANKRLSPSGQTDELRELRTAGEAEINALYDDAAKRGQHVIDNATRQLSGALFHEVDGTESFKRDALSTARAELFELAKDARREPNGAALALDAATGAALLPSGNSAHRLIHEVVTKGSLADAKLLTLAVVRSGPIARRLLGGEAVEQGAVAALTARVIEVDPGAAKIAAERAQGEHVVGVIRGDRSSAMAALAKATRPPSA
jgi:hypothetical protein